MLRYSKAARNQKQDVVQYLIVVLGKSKKKVKEGKKAAG